MAAETPGPSSCPGLQQHHPPSLQNAVTPLYGYPSTEPGPTKLLLEAGGKYSPLASHCHDRSPGQEICHTAVMLKRWALPVLTFHLHIA